MRRAPAQKRKIDPDPVFRSVLVSKVINKVLWKGKKNTAREIVYGALEVVEQRTSQDPSVILKRAVDNVRPQVEVRSRRVGEARTRCQSRYRPADRRLWPFAGWSISPDSGVSQPWRCVSPTRSWTPPTTPGRP